MAWLVQRRICCGCPTSFQRRRNNTYKSFCAQDKKNAGTDWSPRLHKPTSAFGLDSLKSLDGRGRCGGRRLRYVGFGEAISGGVSVVLELAPELHAIEHGAQDVDGKPIDQ